MLGTSGFTTLISGMVIIDGIDIAITDTTKIEITEEELLITLHTEEITA